ncbi:MAG: TolC family protein [Bacteroidota bacterium]|nr:TolC family protein [Candidatus Kapabacteria bacterium]MDW8219795.1 TolC family protein [Bacteroidota bacterium]
MNYHAYACFQIACLLLSTTVFSLPVLSASTPDTLTLRQFLRSVLDTHPLLQSAAFERNIADAELQNALGSFDPVIRAGYDLKYEGSQATPDKINHLVADVELPLNTLFGPKLFAGFARGIGTSLNPEFRTPSVGQTFLGFSVPLWSGVATDRRRTNLEKARLRPLLADANQRLEQNNLLRAAALQYWTWSEALEQLHIAEQVLMIAVQRAEFIASRARRGEVAALDSVEAMQEVERRRGDVYRARRFLEQASIDASIFFWTEAGLPRPLTQFPQRLPELPRLDSTQVLLDRVRAMTLRPEMQRLDFNQQSTVLDLNLAQEGQKPFIEAKTQWMYYPESNIADNFKLGLNFHLPVFFRSAQAQTDLLSISLERIRLQTAQTSRVITADIDNAISALQRAAERVEAAEKEANYAVRMEEGERKRFLAGETALLIVNLRERATAEARVRVVSAKADYLRAWVFYHWATGDMLRLLQ